MIGAGDVRPIDGRECTQKHTTLGLGKVDHTFTDQCGPETPQLQKNKTLTRKEIIRKVWCQPRDRTEEAVCERGPRSLVNHFEQQERGLEIEPAQAVPPGTREGTAFCRVVW